jgi:hypothetical protein
MEGNMQPSSFQGYWVGDRIEKKIIFSHEDIVRIGFTVPEWNQGAVPEKVDSQLMAARVFIMAAGIFNELTAVPIQQEVIFLEPVYLGEEIKAVFEVTVIDELRNWISISVECSNLSGNQVMAGQMVMSSDSIFRGE